MPFSRPALPELIDLASADVETELPGSDALLRVSNLGVMVRTVAGMTHLHFGYLDWTAQQAVPFTAKAEFLEAWAGLRGVVRKGASKASGPVTWTNGVIGAALPINSPVSRGDGKSYVTMADAVVAGDGSLTVTIQAVDAGADGDAGAGTVFTIGAARPGIQSDGVATAAIVGGADVETDDALRGRMLQAYASPPQGGAASDYITWALQVPGVTRAWSKPLGLGAGSVTVYIMLDEVNSGSGGFPSGTDGAATGEARASTAVGDQLAVADWIYPLQPVTALIYVVAPLQNLVAFTVNGLSTASTDVKQAVEAAIVDVFLRDGQPGGSVNVSAIESAIAAIAGTAGFVITSITASHGSVTPGAAGNILSAAGYLPVKGVVTFA